VKTGAIVATHVVPGAKFLNDTALAPDGRILTSDSDAGRIYALDRDAATVLLEDARLAEVNGLLAEESRLVIVTMKGLLLAMDWKTKALTQLGSGFGNADGIAALGDGRFLVSEWPGELWVVNADGAKTTLVDSRAEASYINDFVLAGDRLYVPHWKPGSLSLHRVRR
jgi:sugar lactone lactonase YvrE